MVDLVLFGSVAEVLTISDSSDREITLYVFFSFVVIRYDDGIYVFG